MTNAARSLDSTLRRSAVWRELRDGGAVMAPFGDWSIARDFGAPAAEAALARTLGLADLTPLPRIGFRGAATIDHFRASGGVLGGLVLGERHDWAYRQADGTLALRLSLNELLVLADPRSGSQSLTLRNLAAGELPERCYRSAAPDAQYWFALTGEAGPRTLAKLCAVDFRNGQYAEGRVVQTLVAAATAIVFRHDIGDTSVYHVLGDQSLAVHMWRAIAAAGREYGLGFVGLDAIAKL